MANTYIIEVNQLEAIALAASSEQVRYYINGVHCELYNDNTAGLIATDGHRLASINTQPREAIKDSFTLGNNDVKKAVAMAKAQQKELGKRSGLQAVIRIHKDGENLQVEIAVRDSVAIAKIGGEFKAETLGTEGGNFPDWRRVIPADNDDFCPYISFNGAYMTSFAAMGKLLTDTKTNQLVIKTTGKDSPLKITMPNASEFLGVLMPMRIL
jgi:DNA polymerase III sliding clamp (beta) subunit (PCNA family)